MLIYGLDNKNVDLGTLETDTTPPTITFKEYFFGEKVNLDGNLTHNGPLTTNDGDLFRVSIDLSKYEGPNPISKDDIIHGLIHDITDNRDGKMSIISDDVLIYKDSISVAGEVSEIKGKGNYIIRFNLIDFGRNRNTSTVVISII
jgi:hypothetical protein